MYVINKNTILSLNSLKGRLCFHEDIRLKSKNKNILQPLVPQKNT